MTKAELEKAIRLWFVAASGMTADDVWIDRVEGPKPDRPYSVLTVVSPAIRIGTDEPRVGETIGVGDPLAAVRLVGHRRAQVDAQVYGAGAADYLEQARRGLYRAAASNIARANGILVQQLGDTRDMTGMLDTSFEERAQADIRVGWAYAESSAEAGTIERVIATGTADPVDIDIDETA